MADFFKQIGDFVDDTIDGISDRVDEIKAKQKAVDDKIEAINNKITKLTKYKSSISSYRNFLKQQKDALNRQIKVPIGEGEWVGQTKIAFDVDLKAVLGDFNAIITSMNDSIGYIESEIKSLKENAVSGNWTAKNRHAGIPRDFCAGLS